MISTGEASGELYGALLSRAIKKKWPETEIYGIGGNHMKSEGVRLIAPISSAIGFTETIRHWKQILRSFRTAKGVLKEQKPDILVLIDYPDFNIALAKKAKAAGIPVLYYVSPQVWAWRSGRVKKIASLVNKMLVLFPFEVKIYRVSGLECEFVGHPIAETIDIHGTQEELKTELGLDPSRDVITILPGSRPTEIKKHQQLIKELIEKFSREFPQVQLVIPLVTGTVIGNVFPSHVKILYDCTTEAIACSQVSIVASGTATLQTALLGVPMVVFYRLSLLSFLLAKFLAKVKYISLVNLLSDKEVVSEYIQKDATADNILSETTRLMRDQQYRHAMVSNLKQIHDMMSIQTTSTRVASIVGEIAQWNSTGAS
jgi:lipid-A-disaccharide synthase